MNLRPLKLNDAPLMLEWMHDPSVVEGLQADFMSKTIEDCENFINASLTDDKNLHLAIADDSDEYQGTVSLKHIEGNTAEFAITIRKSAMGKGISKDAMKAIISKGLDELGLSSIYWCVSPDNARAVRFYDKNGYQRIPADKLVIAGDYTEEQKKKYFWYVVNKKEQDVRV